MPTACAGDADPARLEVRERDPVALAFATEQARRGDTAVLEQDLCGVGGALAELVLDARDDVARRLRVDDEARDALLARGAVRDREHDRDVRVLPRRDELLDAVQHVVVAGALGARDDRAGVGTDLGLGQAEAAQPFATRERRQVVLLLHVGAECRDRSADDRVLHADDRRGRAVARRDLLQHDGERDVVEAGAAPALGRHHAHRAQLAQRAELIARKVPLAVPSRCVRREPLLRERAHRVADQLLRLGQQHGVSARVPRKRRTPCAPAS